MNSFYLMLDSFNAAVQNFDILFDAYLSSCDSLYNFVDNNVASIEIGIKDPNLIGIGKVNPSSSLGDSQAMTEFYKKE